MTSKAVVAGTVLLFAAIATASLVRASVAGAAADFVTPRQAAGCGVSEGEPPFRLICWRRADGITLDMTRRGRPGRSVVELNRGSYDPAPGRILYFGKVWQFPGYWKCVSRATGLTCTNRAGHGWWLGRVRGSRLF